MDDDILAAMGIASFGKKQKQRQLDPKRFDKNKRVEVRCAENMSNARADIF